jgi:hypothetical protein
MYGLTKLAHFYKEARSIDAQNRRNYERMLQLLGQKPGEEPMESYQNALLEQRQDTENPRKSGFSQFEENIRAMQNGGTPVYSEAIKWPEIAHGTTAENAEKIIDEGMDFSKFKRGLFGEGAYFSDLKGAQSYADESSNVTLRVKQDDGSVTSYKPAWDSKYTEDDFSRMKDTNYYTEEHRRHLENQNTALEAANFFKKNPEAPFPGASYDRGAVIRMATPSELKGSKIKLPTPNNFRWLDEKLLDKSIQEDYPNRTDLMRQVSKKNNLGLYSGLGQHLKHFHFHGMDNLPAKVLRSHGEIPKVNKSDPIPQETSSRIGKLQPDSNRWNIFSTGIKPIGQALMNYIKKG